MKIINNELLTGTIMLETMWRARKRDLIDLISPFILCEIPKYYSIGEKIDRHKVLDDVKNDFGFIDMPVSVVESVFKRNDALKKNYGNYYYTKPLDSVCEVFEKRRKDCDDIISDLGNKLSEYLSGRGVRNRKYTPEMAIEDLISFFSRFGMYFGIGRMEEHTKDISASQQDYYIAQYIYYVRDNKLPEYSRLIELVKGYYLKSAIYLQSSNSDLTKATYKNVSFYYDTPFILRLLGYKTEEDQRDACELHSALASQMGHFYFFPQTKNEINNILAAYKHHIGKVRGQTLEGLDSKRYVASDVDRLMNTWEVHLANDFSTTIREVPEFTRKKDGSIDERYVINEDELDEFLSSKIYWSSLESKEADLNSILAIHRLRERVKSSQIEHCRAVFVTTNKDLAREANRFYLESVDKDSFPLLITDSDLSALTWIKCGSARDDIPEAFLLRNAYVAMQPTPELIDKFGEVLDMMLAEGKITKELALVIRERKFVYHDLLFHSFDNEDVNEDFIECTERKLREDFSKEAREDERKKLIEKNNRNQHVIYENANNKARKKADTAYCLCQKILVGGVAFIGIVLLIIVLVSMVNDGGVDFSLRGVAKIVVLIITLFSSYDTLKARKGFVIILINRICDKVFRHVYDNKLDEYTEIFNNETEM